MQTTSIRRTILATSGLATSLLAPLAMAHLGTDASPHLHGLHDGQVLNSLVAGALHPLTGPDHLAAMLSVGVWSVLSQGRQGPQTPNGTSAPASRLRLLAAPVAFVGTLLIGAVLGMLGLHLPGVEPMVAVSLLVLGLLLATRASLGTATGAWLVAGFALFHGMAHGQELGGHAIASLVGMILGTAALHLLGMGLGLAVQARPTRSLRWATRLGGGAVAILGLSLLTPAIASVL